MVVHGIIKGLSIALLLLIIFSYDRGYLKESRFLTLFIMIVTFFFLLLIMLAKRIKNAENRIDIIENHVADNNQLKITEYYGKKQILDAKHHH